jgi:predicted RNase H-like HicB family nuclease
MTEPNRYPAQVFWSDDDEGWIALAPDLPGCSAFGENQVAALAELQDAIIAWIGAAKEAGNPVPEPTDTASRSQFSGKLLVRMPKALHQQLATQAQAEQVSLNQYIVFLLTWKNTLRSTTNEGIVMTGISTGFAHNFETQAQVGTFSAHEAVFWPFDEIATTGLSRHVATTKIARTENLLAPLKRRSRHHVTG